MQEDVLRKKGKKDVVYNQHDLRTVLALERTILAKQRTILAEISVLLGVTGLGLILFKFYEQPYARVTGAIAGLIALLTIIRLFNHYLRFKRKVEHMDRKNHIIS